MGHGYTAQKQFAALYGMKRMHHKTQSENETKIIIAAVSNTDDILAGRILKVKKACLELDPGRCVDPLSL